MMANHKHLTPLDRPSPRHTHHADGATVCGLPVDASTSLVFTPSLSDCAGCTNRTMWSATRGQSAAVRQDWLTVERTQLANALRDRL